MKNIFFIVAILATAFVQNSFAQFVTNNREDHTTLTQSSQLLHSYYDIKNALLAGNANTASMKAEEFVKTLNGINTKIINEATRDPLLKDAGHISESKDIKHQREYFATFSTNMFDLAKAVKLSTQPVYYAYCPMKKTHWLSCEPTIKNPYFGSTMLTCGKVEETLK